MSRWGRPGSAALLAVAASGALALAPSSASAAPLSSCSTTRGTIVAVDFGHWSGPVVRGCGVQSNGQPDSSSYALLADGGFTTAGTSHDGPAFTCRLGNGAFHGGAQYPTPAEDHCVVTPPASAYWSYWLAGPTATTWSYATMTQPLPAGGVAYWTFGAGQTPSSSLIGQLRAHNTTPAVGARRYAGGAAAQPKVPVRSTPRATTFARGTGPPAGTAPAVQPPRPAGTTSAPVRSAGPATTSATAGASTTAPVAGNASVGTSAGSRLPDATRVVSSVAPTEHASGSVVPVVVTAALVVALGTAGGVSLRRRRRREQG